MIGNLKNCLPHTLLFEGGWSDNPHDPGGATMKGVTLRVFQRYRPGANAADLRNIDEHTLRLVYENGFWEKIGGDALAPGLDMSAFDAAVNSGPGAALRWLRSSTSLETTDARIKAFASRRLSFLEGLHTFRYFGKGWSRRVAAIEAISLRMALGDGPIADAVIVESAASHAAASRRLRVGGHTVVTGGVASAVAAHVKAGVPWPLIAAGLALVCVVALVIYVKSSQHAVRAAA